VKKINAYTRRSEIRTYQISLLFQYSNIALKLELVFLKWMESNEMRALFFILKNLSLIESCVYITCRDPARKKLIFIGKREKWLLFSRFLADLGEIWPFQAKFIDFWAKFYYAGYGCFWKNFSLNLQNRNYKLHMRDWGSLYKIQIKSLKMFKPSKILLKIDSNSERNQWR
jgi:hypothetical protein